jgi:hypothetical protein
VSGRRRFNVVKPEWERRIAEMQYAQVMGMFEGALLPDWDPRTVRVRRVLQRLVDGLGKLESEGLFTEGGDDAAVTAGSACYSRQEGLDGWTVHVVDSKVANAFVMPG